MDKEVPLLKQTMRMVGIMVGACVVFLAALSLLFVVLLRAPSTSSDEPVTPVKTASTKGPS